MISLLARLIVVNFSGTIETFSVAFIWIEQFLNKYPTSVITPSRFNAQLQ